MARSLLSAIQSLTEKTDRLAAQMEKLRRENQDLREENERLKGSAAETARRYRDKELEAEFLSMSHKLADSPQKLADSRRHIARLIRILDKCLDLLKEDPKL